jgi:hypothetical protein
MMKAIQEYEVRLFDDKGHQFLIVPVVAETEDEAKARAELVRKAHGAARFEVKPVGLGTPPSARRPGQRDTT